MWLRGSSLSHESTRCYEGRGALECDLSSHAWKPLGMCKGFKYKHIDPSHSSPCKIIILKERAIKVLAKNTGTLPTPLPEGNGITEMDLRLFGASSRYRYCPEWGADGYFKAVAD